MPSNVARKRTAIRAITKTCLRCKQRSNFSMKASSLVLVLALVLEGSLVRSRAGTITGTVRAQGKAGADAGAAGGKYDSRQFKFVERVNYDELTDFVVYIEGKVGTNIIADPKEAQVVETKREIKQKGAVFSPHVLPVMTGGTVKWPNNDDILHNVFSISETKPFDLQLYKAPAVKEVQLDRKS